MGVAAAGEVVVAAGVCYGNSGTNPEVEIASTDAETGATGEPAGRVGQVGRLIDRVCSGSLKSQLAEGSTGFGGGEECCGGIGSHGNDCPAAIRLLQAVELAVLEPESPPSRLQGSGQEELGFPLGSLGRIVLLQ